MEISTHQVPDVRRRAARAIAESLAIGDHTGLPHPYLRGFAGLICLVVAAAGSMIRPRATGKLPDADTFVVANPVAHGARLATAVLPALPADTTVVADVRLAAGLDVSWSFPGIGMRSVASVVTARRLLRAVQLRWSTRISRPWTQCWVYGEYLFLAQALRFDFACEVTHSISPGRLLLTDFDRPAYAAPILAAARMRGLVTATLVHGSPTGAYLPVVAQHVLAWGEAQRAWFTAKEPSAVVHVVGRPDIAEADAEQRTGPGRLIIAHSCETLVAAEAAELVALLHRAAERGMQTQLRLHPSDPNARRGGGWELVRRASAQVVVGETALASTLGRDDIVVTVTSSAAIDALMRGVRVYVVESAGRDLPVDLARIKECQVDPFGDMVSAGQLRDVIVAARGATAQDRLRTALREIVADSTEELA